jgi:hypothetical protein
MTRPAYSCGNLRLVPALEHLSSSARFRLQQAAKTIERALDALNFFLADVRDGLGPYLAIYLLTEKKWD